MHVQDRRQHVLEQLSDRGQVSVAKLSLGTGVSEMTIRRDLEALEREGLARRVHGGAVSAGLARLRAAVRLRAGAARSEGAIGRLAATLVSDGETAIVDVGSTTLELARALAAAALVEHDGADADLHVARELGQARPSPHRHRRHGAHRRALARRRPGRARLRRAATATSPSSASAAWTPRTAHRVQPRRHARQARGAAEPAGAASCSPTHRSSAWSRSGPCAGSIASTSSSPTRRLRPGARADPRRRSGGTDRMNGRPRFIPTFSRATSPSSRWRTSRRCRARRSTTPQAGVQGIVDAVRVDVELLVDAGFDAVIFCNENDRPYELKAGLDVRRVRRASSPRSRRGPSRSASTSCGTRACALAVAVATGASFMREVVHRRLGVRHGPLVTDAARAAARAPPPRR